MSPDALELLTLRGHQALRVEDGITRQLERNDRTPITIAAYLQGRIGHGLDFASLDKVVADLDDAIKEHGAGFRITVTGEQHTLIGLRRRLDGVLGAVAPYRAKVTPLKEARTA